VDWLSNAAASPLVAAVVGSLIAVLGLLGLGPWAAARHQQNQQKSEAERRQRRIVQAVRIDIAIARSVATHNIQSAENPQNAERPRAFVPLRTQFYEDLLSAGEVLTLFEPPVRLRLTPYLLQARHINSMINAFNRLESARHSAKLRAQYVNGIRTHSISLQDALGALEAGLSEAEGSSAPTSSPS